MLGTVAKSFKDTETNKILSCPQRAYYLVFYGEQKQENTEEEKV